MGFSPNARGSNEAAGEESSEEKEQSTTLTRRTS